MAASYLLFPPRDGLLLYAKSTTDTIGESTILADRSGNGNDISVFGYCPTFTGGEYLAGNQIIGTETISDYEGTGTPSVSVGRIDVTAGTLEWFEFDDGRKYILHSSSISGQTVSVNANNTDDKLDIVGFTSPFFTASGVGAALLADGYTFRENLLKNSGDTTQSGWLFAAGANETVVSDGVQVDISGSSWVVLNSITPLFQGDDVLYISVDLRSVDGSTGTVRLRDSSGWCSPNGGYVEVDGTMRTYTVSITFIPSAEDRTSLVTIYSGGTLSQVVFANLRLHRSLESVYAETGNNWVDEYRPKRRVPNSLGTVVCIGDSITRNKYPNYLSELLTNSTIVDSGVSGNGTYQMYQRYQTDVLDHDPDYILILGGINDIVGTSSFSNITTNLQAMIDDGQTAGATVVISTIMPYGNNSNWSSSDQTLLEQVNAWILTSDADIKVDSYAAMVDGVTDNLLAAFDGGDGLHPSDQGQEVNTQLFFNSLTKAYTAESVAKVNILASSNVFTIKLPVNVTLVAVDDDDTWHDAGDNPINVAPENALANENNKIFKGDEALLFYNPALIEPNITKAVNFVD